MSIGLCRPNGVYSFRGPRPSVYQSSARCIGFVVSIRQPRYIPMSPHDFVHQCPKFQVSNDSRVLHDFKEEIPFDGFCGISHGQRRCAYHPLLLDDDEPTVAFFPQI